MQKNNLIKVLTTSFLIVSLVAVTITLSDPSNRQLLASFAATNLVPPATNYLAAPAPVPVATPVSPTAQTGANNLVTNFCSTGCSKTEILLQGQTAGRIGYQYQSGTIAGFYEYPAGSGKFYPVNSNSGGPTETDLAKLAQTVAAQKAATIDPQALSDLIALNPSAAAATEIGIKTQCLADKVGNPGLYCVDVGGLMEYLRYQQDTAKEALAQIYLSQPGTYTDAQIRANLDQLKIYADRNVITLSQYNGAVIKASDYITQTNAVNTAYTKAIAGDFSSLDYLKTHNTDLYNKANSIIQAAQQKVAVDTDAYNKAVGGDFNALQTLKTSNLTLYNQAVAQIQKQQQAVSQVQQTTQQAPTATITPPAPINPTNFVQYVTQAISQRTLTPTAPAVTTPTPPKTATKTPYTPTLPGITSNEPPKISTNTTNQPPTQIAISNNIQVITTKEKTDTGFITTTSTIARDPVTGQITNTKTQQTTAEITSTYTNTPNGIVRTDVTITKDFATGKVISRQTSDTEVTKLTPVIAPGNLPPFPTFQVNSNLPTTNQTSTRVLTQTFVDIGTSVGKVATDIAHSLGVTLPQTIISSLTGQPSPSQTSVSSNENAVSTKNSPSLFQQIASWFTGGANTTATVNTPLQAAVPTLANPTVKINVTQQPPINKPAIPIIPPNQTVSNQAPKTENISPTVSMVQFAQSKTSQCYQGYSGYYNACLGSPYHGSTLQPGMTINPIFGGNPEGNPDSMYFCTTLIIDAAKNIGVNLPNSTGALQMYQNFTNKNSIILSENANLQSANPSIKPGMAAFISKPTGVDTSYNVGHVGLVESTFYDSDGVLNVKILQTNANKTEETYKLDSQGRLYTTVHGVPYYIRGFGDIQAYAQATNQTIKTP